MRATTESRRKAMSPACTGTPGTVKFHGCFSRTSVEPAPSFYYGLVNDGPMGCR